MDFYLFYTRYVLELISYLAPLRAYENLAAVRQIHKPKRYNAEKSNGYVRIQYLISYWFHLRNALGINSKLR